MSNVAEKITTTVSQIRLDLKAASTYYLSPGPTISNSSTARDFVKSGATPKNV